MCPQYIRVSGLAMSIWLGLIVVNVKDVEIIIPIMLNIPAARLCHLVISTKETTIAASPMFEANNMDARVSTADMK